VKTKILLDTDIGSDIDDAVCLAYLLANPDCELMGITTVTGEAVKRARIASAICRIAAKDTPIFPGVESPLLIDQKQPTAPQASALDKWEHDRNFPGGEAVRFLQETIHANPDEIILLTIGPLTNIGLLLSVDPEIPVLLKGIVSMAGVYTDRVKDRTEWNISCDPHAAAIVYNTPLRLHRSVGLDVTRRVTMQANEVRRRFQAPLLRPVLDFAEVWFQQTEDICFHDPLAAATIFDDSICSFEKGHVEVDIRTPDLLGKTSWTPGGDGHHEVALEVAPEKFIEHYFSFF
jgi:inosine-uridine nucleoside N-ribohydrolase